MLSELPDEWTLNPLAKLLQPSLFIDGDWVESKDQSPDGDVRLIQLADIGDGHFIDKSDRHLTKDAAVRLKCTFLKKGDLLVARMPEPLGRCCVFPLDGEERFVTVVDVAVMRPHDNFNSIWLMNLVNSGYARKFIEDNAGGTTRTRISRKNLGGLPLPVPPLNEQHRIAEILSSVDASIQATQAVIEQAERVKRGLMEELLTGGLGSDAIERGEVPEGWTASTFGDEIEFKGGNQPPKSTFVYEPTEGYVRLLQIRDFENDDNPAYIPVDATKVRCTQNDILIARYGASLGRICRGKEGAYNVALVKLILSENLHSDYAYYWLNSEHFQNFLARVGSRSAQAGFNKSDLAPLSLALPPFDKQIRISKILSSVDELLAAQKIVVEQQTRTKNGLMDDLLTGKVRTV